MRNLETPTSPFLGLSLLVHASLALLITFAPMLSPLPEGTISPTTQIEFTALEAPKGNQLKTIDVGQFESEAPTQPEKTLPEIKEIKSQTAPEVVVVAPPPMPKKQKAAPKVAKVTPTKTKKLETKPIPTELVSESEVPVDLPSKKESVLPEKQPELAALDEEELKKELSDLDLGGTIDSEEGIETAESLDKELESELKTLEDSAVTTEKKVEVVPEKEVAQPSKVKETTQAAAPALAKGMPQKSEQLKHESNMNYGVPTGVRDYRDLVQIPGNIPPQYPEPARRNREMGQVRLMYFVTQDGSVSSLKMVQSSGHVELDNEAMRAIRKYRFQPGQQGYTSHTINFSLRGDAKATGGTLRTSSNQKSFENRTN